MLTLLGIASCSDRSASDTAQEDVKVRKSHEVAKDKDFRPKIYDFPSLDYNAERWVEITNNEYFAIDIRYATENNFMKQVIYDCPRCFVDPATAKKLNAAAIELKAKNYKVQLFDCFRPRQYQQKLWNIMPDASYVTPPWKGSMHNRGSAVDISLAYLDGTPVDMGTDYDYFGKEAHYAYSHLDSTIIAHRKLLRSTMEKHGFQGIRTEWWHFSNKQSPAELSDWIWSCD